MVERKEGIEEQMSERNRDTHRAAIVEYDKCKVFGILGMGWNGMGRKYGIPGVWVSRYIKGEYQEDLESSDEELSTGDY